MIGVVEFIHYLYKSQLFKFTFIIVKEWGEMNSTEISLCLIFIFCSLYNFYRAILPGLNS
jgi:hypothetical protein